MVELGFPGVIMSEFAPGSAFVMGVVLGLVIFVVLKMAAASGRTGSSRAQSLHIDLGAVIEDQDEAGRAERPRDKSARRTQGTARGMHGRRWQFDEVFLDESLEIN
jgi:hypothetical protein